MNPGRQKTAGVSHRPRPRDPLDPENFKTTKAMVDVAFDEWLKRRGFPPIMSWQEQSDAQCAARKASKPL
jgi:hypothetical protein